MVKGERLKRENKSRQIRQTVVHLQFIKDAKYILVKLIVFLRDSMSRYQLQIEQKNKSDFFKWV
jgi:hypothetical protein